MPEKPAENARPWYIQALPGLVWLASAGLGLYAIYNANKLATLIYSLIAKEYYIGVLVGQVTTVVAGLAWIVAIVAGGETWRKYAGGRRTWRLLGWVIGVELALILLGILFG